MCGREFQVRVLREASIIQLISDSWDCRPRSNPFADLCRRTLILSRPLARVQKTLHLRSAYDVGLVRFARSDGTDEALIDTGRPSHGASLPFRRGTVPSLTQEQLVVSFVQVNAQASIRAMH